MMMFTVYCTFRVNYDNTCFFVDCGFLFLACDCFSCCSNNEWARLASLRRAKICGLCREQG